MKNVASPSIAGPLAQNASSNYEPCAPIGPLQARCNSHHLVGPAALVLSAFQSVQETVSSGWSTLC